MITHILRRMPVNRQWICIVISHTGLWLIFILINNILLFSTDTIKNVLIRTSFTYPLVAALFYSNAYLVANRFIPRRQYSYLIIGSLLLLALYTLLRFSLYNFLFPFLGMEGNYVAYKFMFDLFFRDSIWLALQYLLLSYGYWFACYQINSQKEKQALIIKMAALEKESMLTEIAFLQAQINPHFLYNTFNFLYSEAFLVSPKLADAILTVSTVMRSLTELGKKPFLPVHLVLDLIDNYLKLQRYRFGDTLPLQLTVDGDEYLNTSYVPPLVFISLIENIFKHGDLSDNLMPARVYFQLTQTTLVYRSSNRVLSLTHPLSTSVGMTNLRNQLQLLYGDKFTIHRAEEQGTYRVELVILDTTIIR